MSLTHQFIITLALPSSFLVLLLYDLRKQGSLRHGPFWVLTLLLAALWSSHLLSYYVGVEVPAEVIWNWRVGGRHLLGTLAIFILLTTMAHLGTAPGPRNTILGISLIFWLAALLLDPAILPVRISPWTDASDLEAHFNLWAGVWVTSWLIPLLAATMLTRQAVHDALSAVYRNRLNYWVTTLIIFVVSGLLALIQQQNQPAWQQLGGLGITVAASLGTVTLVRGSLPNLRLAMRKLLARLTTSLLILASIWAFLVLLITEAPLQDREWTVLELGLAAALLTALLAAINRYAPGLLRRLLLPEGHNRTGVLADQPALVTALPDPEALGEILLRLSQYNIAADNARLLFVDEQHEDEIVLRSLAQVGHIEAPDCIEIPSASAIAAHLRRRPPTPLSMYELESMPAFADVNSDEMDLVHQGNIEIFMPLGAGDELVGVLMLGEKYTREPYDHADLLWLQDLGTHGGLLLWQAKELKKCTEQLEALHVEMEEMKRDGQHLHELLALYERFSHLVSPSLRRPFGDIHHTLQELQVGNGAHEALSDLQHQFAQLRLKLNNLILTAANVRRQHDFSFERVDVIQLVHEVVRDLSAMASARHVTVNVIADSSPLTVEADYRRLSEAVQHLLHNAIRFNRIGGQVDINCGITGKELYLHVQDNGVGMSPEKLAYVSQDTFSTPNENAVINRGLGLVLTRFIARAHGGHLELSSEHGNGSTFSIYLPLTTPSASQLSASQDAVTAA